MQRPGQSTIIDTYIASQSKEVQPALERICQIIREEAPQAEEVISYGMPTFRLKRNLVHFAAQRDHLGFYPDPSAIEKFANELSTFKTSKGTIRIPYDEPLPEMLIRRIVRFRLSEELNR